MRSKAPFLALCMLTAACTADEAPPPADADDTAAPPLVDDTGAPVAEDAPDIALPVDDDGPVAESFLCSSVCAVVGGVAGAPCSEFGIPGIAACAFSSNALCTAVCNSRGPRSHCSWHDGSEGCVNQQYMWWCDHVVDGHSVRMRYELRLVPGVVASSAAPRRRCSTVRWPTTNDIKRWQVCTDGKGCSGWFYP